MPQTSVLNPVLAPAFTPAADSGLMRIGGPLINPERNVARPQTISNQRPRGMLPSGFVSFDKSLSDRARPFKTRIYKNTKSQISNQSSDVTISEMLPGSVRGLPRNSVGQSPTNAIH